MSIFKAYDIRGVYPDQIDEKIARRVGEAMVDYLQARRLIVGHDMRTMADSMTDAFVDGVLSRGCDVTDIGLVSTPAVYCAIGEIACDGGAVITASHNPKEYTGIKMCKAGPVPLSGDEGIPEIKALAEGSEPTPAPTRGKREPFDIKPIYLDKLIELTGGPEAIAPQKIVVDYANGMGIWDAPEAFARFKGLEVIPLYDSLDGTFPNHEANPLREENLQDLKKAVRENGATLGLAFDGDADRCAFVDEEGRTVGADLITVILARFMLERHPGRCIIYDLRSSKVLPEKVLEYGGKPVKERVGHAFMKATMKREGCIGGGELSGHFYFSEFYNSDSGLLAGLRVLAQLSKEGKTLKQAADELRIYYQSGEINFRVENKEEKMEEVVKAFPGGKVERLDGILITFPDWWVNVRPSNTEPYLRLVLEADSEALLEEKKKELIQILGTPV